MNNESTSVLTYILIFSAMYAGFMVCINLLAQIFNIEIGSSASVAILVGAGYGTAVKFVQDNKRPPYSNEKRLLSFGCLISSFIISIASLLIVVPLTLGESGMAELRQLINELSLIAWLLIISIVSVFYYALLSVIFGWAANKYASKANF